MSLSNSIVPAFFYVCFDSTLNHTEEFFDETDSENYSPNSSREFSTQRDATSFQQGRQDLALSARNVLPRLSQLREK
jgi:hypothetical protein